MRCANCQLPIQDLSRPCPHCHFQGDPALLAVLAHVEWLLAEVVSWPAHDAQERYHNEAIGSTYRARQRDLRIRLGLIYDAEQAKKAWPRVFVLEAMLRLLGEWQAQGFIFAAAAQNVASELRGEVETLRRKLEGHTPALYPVLDSERLFFANEQLRILEQWNRRLMFVGPPASDKARAPIAAEQERLEIKLGMRTAAPAVAHPADEPAARRAAEATEAKSGAQPASTAATPPKPPRPPAPPPLPLRDRFWRTLLSERTLQALLFLGIFLLFAAAVSFVIWGWETFPAPLRVAIPTAFTIGFFALGWYVRTRTQLFRSGIALSAIASLLIPIDFYTVYANFDISPDVTPSFWLVTSLLCLAAYIFITSIVRSRFFGYLVGAAAGSTALALVEVAHQGLALSLDWRSAALSVLAGGFVATASAIDRRAGRGDGAGGMGVLKNAPTTGAAATDEVGSGVLANAPTTGAAATDEGTTGAPVIGVGMLRMRSRAEVEGGRAFAFAEPLRNLGLLTVAVLMPLTFGWRYIERHGFDSLHSALTVNWLVGALIFGWGAIYYRSRGLGILAAIALPVATYLGQAGLFEQAHVNAAWHAFGWALLVPCYFYTSHRLRARRDDPVLFGHGRTVGGWGVLLLVVAALWSLLDISSGAAAAASHAVLAGAVVLATAWWQRPAWLYAASVLTLSAATFGMSQLGLPVAQMGIGWATLAIAHVLVALRIGQGSAARQRFARPLVVAGYLSAALALLPGLAPYNADLFIYTLANWIGLAAWGARLAHTGQAGFAPGVLKNAPTTKAGTTEVVTTGAGEEGGRKARPYTDDAKPGVAPGVLANAPTSRQHRYGGLRYAIFHWLAAAPIPVWLWAVIAQRGPLDAVLPLALAALAWLMIGLSLRLATVRAAYRMPWYITGLLVSLTAIEAAYLIAPGGRTLAVVLLSAGLLYFADAVLNRQSIELLVGGLVTALGFGLLLERLRVAYDAATLAQALLVMAYIVAGLATERWRSKTYSHNFLAPLFVAAHIVSGATLLRVYAHPLYSLVYRIEWTDEMLAWGAACQLILSAAYAMYAWGRFNRLWAYGAVWLATAGGGFVALLYSTGSGSLAARAALGAIVFIVAERALHDLRRRGNDLEARLGRQLTTWQRAVVRALWRLFHEPLLVSGWLISLVAIGTALVRNLVLLGGGRTPQTWAAVGLLLVVALYTLSARLFRQARFLWFASVLVFAPWTIITNLGFFVGSAPSVPGFAVSWVALAWLLYLAGLALNRFAPAAYALSLKVTAHVMAPGALLWGMGSVDTSRVSVMLAIGFYGLAAALDFAAELRQATTRATLGQPLRASRLQLARATRFFYPWLGLIPVWCLYLLAWLLPTAQQELYGLLLIVFGPLGLAAGQWLERVAPQPEPAVLLRPDGAEGRRDATSFGRLRMHRVARAYGLPAYLTGYVAVIFGTLLVAHIPALLALVLLYDAGLMLASARVFRQPLWLYLAAVLTPISLGLALGEASTPFNRYGWWLIALAAVYCGLAWALRRLRLPAYSTPLLMTGFALAALGLPPSSRDQDGALFGYAGAALLFTLNAFWLRQPLLLTAASALVLVPYAVLLRRSPLPEEQYGLALLPGAVAALLGGVLLDRRLGARKNFPWGDVMAWPGAVAERLLEWWALPLYTLGFGLAAASPMFTSLKNETLALDFLLLMPIFGWAIYAFRLRGWLVATALAGHLAWLFWLLARGWSALPTEMAIRFTPVTVVTAAIALMIERWRNEGSPLRLDLDHSWRGWSHVLYVFVFVDLYATQGMALQGTWAGALVSLSHALLIGVLAGAWLSWWLPYLSTLLGIVAYQQWLSTLGGGAIEGWPVALSYLALAYGLAGFGLRFARTRYEQAAAGTRRVSLVRPLMVQWEAPLERAGLLFSLAILALTAWLGIDLAGWTIRALLGTPVRQIVRLPVAQMVVGVCSVLGLLYVTAAVGYRRMRLGYLAIGMLLLAWCVHAFYVQQWDEPARVQWYALPAGIYLLAIAYLEWRRGNRDLARWLDYAAIVLMMGSLFWQTLLYGWSYALLLGAEGFGAFWWGSARRLRRFLYIGMLGVVLATVAQLLNALQSVNQWIVFGLIGLLVVITAVAIERQLEAIKVWRETLETWE